MQLRVSEELLIVVVKLAGNSEARHCPARESARREIHN